MQKFFYYFVGIIFVFLLGLMLYLAQFADEPLDDFSDLEPTLTEVPREKNGFQTILATSDALEASSNFTDVEAIEECTTEEIELFEKFYTSNKVDFEALHEAIASEFIQEPISYDIAAEIRAINLIYVSKILTQEIKYHTAKGDLENAFKALNSQIQLGQKHLASEGGLVQHVIALAIITDTLKNQYTLLNREGFLPNHLLETPQLSEDINASFQTTMDIEWLIYSNTLDTYIDPNMTRISRVGILRPFIYQPNKTHNSLAQIHSLAKRIHAAPFAKKQSLIDELDLSIPSSSSIITSNYIGEELLTMIGSTAHQLTSSNHYSILLKNRTLHLLVALRSYSNDHGKELPKDLTELVPTYLSSIPLDPFAEKPLLYSKKNKLIWSIGSDLVDDHGVSMETLSADEKNPLKTLEFEDEPHLAIPF